MRPSLLASLSAAVLVSFLLAGTGAAVAQEATPVSPPATGPVEVLWQSEGDPDRPLLDPFQLTIDPAGSLWVADAESRFLILTPDGTVLESWGEFGSDEGELDFVVERWDPTGAAAFDSTGHLYVLDPGNHRVQKFAPDRTFLTSWGSEGDGDGQFGHPYDIAVDDEGRVYVIDDVRDDIQVFTGDGRFLATISSHGSGEDQLFNTGSLTIAPDGTIWVADWGSHRVKAFSPEGDHLVTFGSVGTDEGELNGPLDVAVDGDGRIYVVDWGNNRIQLFTHNGTLLGAFGGYGTGESQFTQPSGITIDKSGVIYVSDGELDRVTAFRLLPPLAPAATPST